MKRFSPEVVSALNQAIDKLKNDTGSPNVELVGYSGGGGLAILVAARRNDVVSIRTVAANLDHKALCDYHHVSPLTGSLNPIDYAQIIKTLPQQHFVGAEDKTVPIFIARSFIECEGDESYERITVVKNTSHTKGWRKHWQHLLGVPLQ